MIIASQDFINMMDVPARRISARAELFPSSASVDNYNRELLDIFTYTDALKDFTIDRVGEDSKFFGFGICQKLTLNLRDKERIIDIVKGNIIEISFGVDEEYVYPYPLFRVEEVVRDENNNDLKITAYDFLYKAGEHRVSELSLTSYTLGAFIGACANVLGLPINLPDYEEFSIDYPQGANFDGSETLRQALNAAAEATQTIFFVDWDWRLTFKRLDIEGDAALAINKNKYFTLESKPDRTLTSVCHATELGDNVSAGDASLGVVQYVRNNPFWDLREDIATLVGNALTNVNGTSINQFNVVWRGNVLLEIGDRISITTKDDNLIYGYIVNDVISYNGGLKETCKWSFTEHTAETASNPITLGDALNQTYAKVDKVNREITLVASEVERVETETDQKITEAKSEIKMTTDAITLEVERVESELGQDILDTKSEIKVTTDEISLEVSRVETDLTNDIANTNSRISNLEVTTSGITASVSEIRETTANDLDAMSDDIATLTNRVDASMSAEDIRFEIQSELANGTSKVTTTTGFTFNEEGLTVSKSGSEMTTQITEDGMSIYRDNNEVLTADNTGVKAENLHATTYLIIGKNSRFEDYESNRTGCFWIGG